MKFDSELIHTAALFNPEVFKHSSQLIAEFPWVTEVPKTLFKENRPLSSFSDVAVASMLSGVMISDEIGSFIELVSEMKKVQGRDQIDELINGLFKYYKTRKVHEIVNKHSSDVDSLVRDIKKVPDNLATCVEIVKLGSLDIQKTIEDEIGDVSNPFPTNFPLIADSTPFKGYLRGQVVQWVGAPGRGKSATMLYEATLMAVHGHKILWLAMGDLMRYDFITRFTAVLTNTEYYKVAMHAEKYFTDDVREVANNIDLITIPAGHISPEELQNLVDTAPVEYDVVVVDYDSNFKMEGDNMYKDGGEVYNILTSIARPIGKKARLVFIASQPKIQFWDELEIPLEGAGESSRKQHIIDIMITLGTANADRPAGMMYLPKVRRGKPGGKAGYMMTESGQVMQITKEELSMLRRY